MLRACLSVFDKTLHASLYGFGLFIPPVGMSGYALSVEHALEASIFFGTTFVTFSVYLVFAHKAALRVPLAVTWLTVYRQLQIPAKV